MTGKLTVAWLVAMLAFGSGAASQAAPGEEAILKDWALSRCLYHAYRGQPASDDAARAAAVYLEQADSGMGVHERLEQLAKAAAVRPAAGSVPGSYRTLNCIAFYKSRELARIVRPSERVRLQKAYDDAKLKSSRKPH